MGVWIFTKEYIKTNLSKNYSQKLNGQTNLTYAESGSVVSSFKIL